MAASSNPASTGFITLVASEAIPARRLVKLHSVEGQVALATASTDVAIGVSTTTAATNGDVEIQTQGIALLETTAASVAINAQVMPGTSGRCLTAAGATAVSVGLAVSASGGTTAGETIGVWLNVPNIRGPANS